MKSQLFSGFVEHTRYHPVKHSFRYRIYCYGLDLDELDVLDRKNALFGYNRRRPAALFDADYLDDRPGRIREKLIRILDENRPKTPLSSVFMITSARYLNYVFNPVSFYYCFDDARNVTAMVAEVNNTFGERHVYIPEKATNKGPSANEATYHARKAFHVSPFNNLEGEYTFHFPAPEKELNIRIDLIRDSSTVFSARLWGTPVPLTAYNLFKMMIRHPMMPHLTKPRIFMEAARLYFSKHLSYHPKPEPASPMTIKRLR
jgi:cyclopropane-fatty-acyl-phospholipid synthase